MPKETGLGTSSGKKLYWSWNNSKGQIEKVSKFTKQTNEEVMHLIYENKANRMKRKYEEHQLDNLEIERNRLDLQGEELSMKKEPADILQPYSSVDRVSNALNQNLETSIQGNNMYITFSDNSKFDCKLCGESFENQDDYDLHQISHAGQTETFSCNKCSKFYYSLADLKRHKRTHQSLKSYFCNVCSRVFMFRSHFTSHMKEHSDDGYTSQEPISCTRENSSGDEINLPIENTTKKKTEILLQPKLHQCTICQRSFAVKQDLRRHIDSHLGIKRFPCHICPREYSRGHNLKKHMETHKNEPDGTCYCKFCYEKFIDEAMYEQHLLKHHSEQEHLTSHNSETKDGTKDLSGEEHEINHPLEEEEGSNGNSVQEHGLSTGQKHGLSTGQKQDLSNTSQQEHALNYQSGQENEFRHYSEQDYRLQALDTSDNTANRRNNIVQKIIDIGSYDQNDGEKLTETTVEESLSCDICGKVLANKKSLYYHRLNHTQDKRHQCTMCDRSYVHKKDLNRHYKSHSAIKPHLCLTCGKSYLRSNDLKDHLATHVKGIKSDNISDISTTQIQILLDGQTQGPFECNICGKKLASKKSLKRHCSKHTEERKHMCTKCDKSYVYRNELNLHMKTHDGIQYMCPICGKSFVTGYVLNRHMRRFHKDTKSNKIMKKMGIKRKWNCSKCGYNFLRYIDLKRHKLTHPMLKTLNCTFCSRKFVFHMHFKCHLKSHETNQSETENNSSDEKHKCLECGKEYIQSELQRHMLSHMNIKPYVCNICQKSFSRPNNLKMHTQEVHCDSKDQRNFTCIKCKKSFCTLRRLKCHIRRHILSKNPHYQCENCKRKFSTKQDLLQHTSKNVCTNNSKSRKCDQCGKFMRLGEEIHKNVCPKQNYHCNVCDKTIDKYFDYISHEKLHLNKREYKCDLCDKSYVKNKDLLIHRRHCHQNVVYPCQICGKVFQAKLFLKKHMYNVHNDEKNCICHVCGKSFKDAEDVRIHMRSHTCEKPFPCKMCVRSFISSSALSRHMNVHSDLRPYICETCGKAFKFPNNLREHSNTHKTEKIYDCIWCDKSFVSKSYLNRHVSKAHNLL